MQIGFINSFPIRIHGIMKCKKKQIDDTIIILFSIGLNGLAKNSYMNIGIPSCNVDGVG
jgi:hypothetical protein